MPVPEIDLTGGAFFGVVPALAPPRPPGLLGEFAERVRLGARLVSAPPSVPRLSKYIDRAAGRPAPERVDWSTRARQSLSRMYLNDQLGCCVISGKAHALGTWSANDPDSPGEIQATDDEIRRQYVGWCGPGDNGCFITRVLDRCVNEGFAANGKRYRLDAYVSVDHRDADLTRTALYLFGCLTVGIDLPAAWTSAAVWDVTNTRSVGGHDVTAIGYDPSGVYVSSWGRVYRITWPAWTHQRYIGELYALLDPTWYGSDKLSGSGVQVDALRRAVEVLKGGGVPEIPDEPPPVPPDPPAPPAPPPEPDHVVYDLEGTITGSLLRGQARFKGTATPRRPSNG